jgi:hypothetical protein
VTTLGGGVLEEDASVTVYVAEVYGLVALAFYAESDDGARATANTLSLTYFKEGSIGSPLLHRKEGVDLKVVGVAGGNTWLDSHNRSHAAPSNSEQGAPDPQIVHYDSPKPEIGRHGTALIDGFVLSAFAVISVSIVLALILLSGLPDAPKGQVITLLSSVVTGALGYVFGKISAAKLLGRDEARGITASLAKLPDLFRTNR